MANEHSPERQTDPNSIESRREFAKELTAVRERAGLSIRDVAGKIGVPYSTLGDYFGGSHLPPARLAHVLVDILSACGVTDDLQIDAWSQALKRLRRAPGRRAKAAPIPYRGLASYQPEDAGWFFGRDELCDLLLSRLSGRSGSRSGLLAVIGPSGSGKSSLLRAGLIPAVRAGRLVGLDSEQWTALLMTPGERPVQELADHLAAEPSGGPLVVVVDQFEEVFTTCEDEIERAAFIEQVCYLGRLRDADTLIVIGLRADFYAQALRHPALVVPLQDAQVVVGPMNREEIRRAILEPARKANIDVEEGLVELLLSDLAPVAGHIGAAHDAARPAAALARSSGDVGTRTGPEADRRRLQRHRRDPIRRSADGRRRLRGTQPRPTRVGPPAVPPPDPRQRRRLRPRDGYHCPRSSDHPTTKENLARS